MNITELEQERQAANKDAALRNLKTAPAGSTANTIQEQLKLILAALEQVRINAGVTELDRQGVAAARELLEIKPVGWMDRNKFQYLQSLPADAKAGVLTMITKHQAFLDDSALFSGTKP